MNSSRESLDRLLQKARTAPPPALPLEEPLPPGTATRIAARWAAARSPVVLWERFSYGYHQFGECTRCR